MFLKIFSLPISRYVFLIGFVINGLIVMFRGFPFMNSLFVAFIGGLVFCGVWAGIIMVLTFLLTEQELSYYFNIPFTGEEYSDEDEDALTMDELYNMNSDDENNYDNDFNTNSESYSPHALNKSDISSGYEGDSLSENSYLPEEDLLKEDVTQTKVALNRPEQFELTVGGKTLKAHPKDGANAIRKVLYDEKNGG